MITFAQYMEMKARLEPKVEQTKSAGVEHEADLHDQILDYCRAKGWRAIHSRMDRPTTTGKGDPDFVVLADGGRFYLVECKSRTGKRTAEQHQFDHHAVKLGHTVWLVRSMAEFRNIVEV